MFQRAGAAPSCPPLTLALEGHILQGDEASRRRRVRRRHLHPVVWLACTQHSKQGLGLRAGQATVSAVLERKAVTVMNTVINERHC